MPRRLDRQPHRRAIERRAAGPLSRKARQAQTRAILVTTATELFVRDGYADTSIDRVAAAAGFTKGAVYSNFRTKDELCLAVLDDLRARRIADLAAEVGGATTLEAIATALDRWASRHIGDPAWTRLEVEFGVQASRRPTFARQLARRHQAVRQQVGQIVAGFAAARGLTLPLPADDIGVALLSLGIGLGVQRAIDPTLSVRTLATLLRMFAAASDGERGSRGR